jgi:hypothetical protein
MELRWNIRDWIWFGYVRIVATTTVIKKITAFWDVMPYSFVDMY